MFYRNDWLTWSFDDIKFGKRLSPQSKFELHFKKVISRPVKSYKEELLENARVLRDTFTEPFDLLFSGGGDSEVILRCYHELKIPINVFIFKYENDYNFHDVRHAIRICDELNITPKIIDFSLEKFFENNAYDIWKTGFFQVAGQLPHMKMFEYLDNIPMLGNAEPKWIELDNKWIFELDELYHSSSFYCRSINRTAVPDWYEFSPEIILSHMYLPEMQPIIDNTLAPDEYIFDIIKYRIYNKMWPKILIRPRRNGFEGFNTQPKTLSPGLGCMEEFQKQYIKPLNLTNKQYCFTKDELIDLLV